MAILGQANCQGSVPARCRRSRSICGRTGNHSNRDDLPDMHREPVQRLWAEMYADGLSLGIRFGDRKRQQVSGISRSPTILGSDTYIETALGSGTGDTAGDSGPNSNSSERPRVRLFVASINHEMADVQVSAAFPRGVRCVRTKAQIVISRHA